MLKAPRREQTIPSKPCQEKPPRPVCPPRNKPNAKDEWPKDAHEHSGRHATGGGMVPKQYLNEAKCPIQQQENTGQLDLKRTEVLVVVHSVVLCLTSNGRHTGRIIMRHDLRLSLAMSRVHKILCSICGLILEKQRRQGPGKDSAPTPSSNRSEEHTSELQSL